MCKKNNGDKFYYGKSMWAVNEKLIPYSAKFLWVFNFDHSWKYFNENFRHPACGVCVQQIHETISMKSSKITIHENLDQKFSTIG